MSQRVQPNAEPGTGTQYMTIAHSDPSDEEIERVMEEEEKFYEEAALSLTQERVDGRRWQCGGEYWDTYLNDLVTLKRVAREGVWCHAGDIEEAPIVLQFSPEHFEGVEVYPNRDDVDAKERFIPRHNVPFRPPP